MNRYKGPSIGGPSKATATTMCQKCLKRDIYECKAVAQERPYVSRPSRTQQLQNPKLMPKLTSDVPQELLRKKGIADEQLAKAELERGRKRERQSEDPETYGGPKRMRSASSVSTISTNKSGNSSMPQERKLQRPMSISRSPSAIPIARSPSLSRSPQRRVTDSERKRRRMSFSSHDSISDDNEHSLRARGSSRSTRRRLRENSPPSRGRKTESRSPHSRAQGHPYNRQRARDSHSGDKTYHRQNINPSREKSLSPFSKRLALTQSMNMNR